MYVPVRRLRRRACMFCAAGGGEEKPEVLATVTVRPLRVWRDSEIVTVTARSSQSASGSAEFESLSDRDGSARRRPHA